MNKKLVFILSIISIILLSLLSNHTEIVGKIKNINYYPERIDIYLEDLNEPIIIFTNKILNLSKEDIIRVEGTRETYKNKEQIIANKIIKINS